MASIDKRIQQIYADSNIPYNIIGREHKWDNLRLNMSGSEHGVLSLITNPCIQITPTKNAITCADVSNSNEVDYLIRLNVIIRMMTAVVREKNVYISIESPGYDDSNIHGAIIYIHEKAFANPPFTGFVMYYIGSSFSCVHNVKRIIINGSTDYLVTYKAVIDFTSMERITEALDQRVRQIYMNSKVLYTRPDRHKWNNLHLTFDGNKQPTLSLTNNPHIQITPEIHPIISVDINDLHKVDYLIRLNVIIMIMTAVVEETNVYISIRLPTYKDGNIDDAIIHIHEQSFSTTPFTDCVMSYIKSSFHCFNIADGIIIKDSLDYIATRTAAIEFISLQPIAGPLDQRVQTIYRDSNVSYVRSYVLSWDNLHLTLDERKRPTLSLTIDPHIQITACTHPITCNDIDNIPEVNYLIRLNVLIRMLADVNKQTGVYIRIDSPKYDNGNIRNATILAYKQPDDPKPFTGFIADYTCNLFSFLYRDSRYIIRNEPDYSTVYNNVCRFITREKKILGRVRNAIRFKPTKSPVQPP